jgi:integrase
VPDYRLERPVINGKQSSVWYIIWTEGRRSRRISTRTADKVEAQGELQRLQACQAAPPEQFTVADLCNAYLAEREANPKVKYPKAIANSLKHIKREMGALPPSMVSRATIRGYISKRRASVKDASISKELRFLRQALKFGVREKWMKDAPHVEVPGESAPRQRFLTRDEFARIFFHASPLHLRTFLALAIDTLARGKHILALTWDRVDFERGIIWYAPHDPSSNKRTQPAPMSDRLRHQLLRAQEAALSDYVIEWNGQRVKSVRKAFESAVSLAGVADAHKHDLRRSGASWAIQDGMSFDAVAVLLGDTVEMTRKTYAVFSPDYLRGVVESISGGSGGRVRA